jgi:hypothetical protein
LDERDRFPSILSIRCAGGEIFLIFLILRRFLLIFLLGFAKMTDKDIVDGDLLDFSPTFALRHRIT